MPAEPFRFVQASDLHLEQPVQGLAEVPEHLRAALLDAPFSAAERVIDATLAESADFLILAGDVLNPRHAGPRGITFLLEQFERLAAREIAVYWAGGQEDPPEEWPTAAKLPPNVHLYASHEVEEITHYRNEHPLCLVAGTSVNDRKHVRPADFHRDPNGLYTIAVAHGIAEGESLAEQPIDYWALGGQHQRKSLCQAPYTAHYCGSPQGRELAESGPHGCTLVSVDHEGKTRTQLLVTDSVRWHEERLAIEGSAKPDDLHQQLSARMRTLASEAGDRTSLVSWTIEALGPLPESARLGWLSRRSAQAAELLAWLRDEFGKSVPPIWTASLEIAPPAALPTGWYEEDTILGDFLRAVQVHLADEQQPLGVATYVADRHREEAFASVLEINDPEARRRVLREAAALGVELLRGESI